LGSAIERNMAIQGNLRDVNLASLIQMLCMDQRRAILNLKRSDIEEGLIYFEHGEIVHALTNSLTGEEAVYHLLSWAEGTFKVNEQVSAPDRTIMMPWNYLLMEGMRLLDEQKFGDSVQTKPETALSFEEMEQDRVLEYELILLLSELEQLQARLANIKNTRQTTTALEILTEITNKVIAFTETLPKATNVVTLSKILTETAKTYSTLRLLQPRNNRLSIEIITMLHISWTGDLVDRRQTFEEIRQGIIVIIEKILAYIIAQFHSNVIVNQWQETSEIFLTELKQAVQGIRF